MPVRKDISGARTAKEPETSIPRISAMAQSVFEALKDDIVFGRLHPRERLVEIDLAERFECNRANVRGALNELAKLGLVEYVANKGASVIDLTIKDIKEIYDVRIELEGLAAQWIPMPVDPGDIEALAEIQARHSEAVAQHDLPVIFEQNGRFHEALNNLCGNRHLTRLIREMAFRALPIRYSTYMSQEYLDNVRDDHLAIVQALRDGDRERLVELTRSHNQRGLEWYRSVSARSIR